MSTGIFGGAFDPPHKEHISLSANAIEELGLDRVVFVPSGIQPHKHSSASMIDRRDMLYSAVLGNPRFIVDDIELNSSSISYAVDVLSELKKKYGKIIYILGADSFLNLDKWMRPTEIISKYPIAVVVRGEKTERILDKKEDYQREYHADIRLLRYQPESVSSSIIRAMHELGLDIAPYVHEGVFKIIIERGLYRKKSAMVEQLRDNLSSETFGHTMRTVLKGMEINEMAGLEFDSVFDACLLHDCAKDMPLDDKYRDCIPTEVIDTPIMHAFLGAVIAKEKYGIINEEVLDAIKYHTTGSACMSELMKLVYLSDKTESGRSYKGLGRIRLETEDDLDKGFIVCLKHNYEYLLSKNTDIDRLTYECIKEYE